MPKVTVNGKEVTVEPGLTVLQACEIAGAEIPRFCYHERLAIAGNCRMCLVEIEKTPKPVASCAMPIAENMVIHTDTPLVKKAREGVMEFLLINHPLDCPICDQGGECDLQDQAMAYGKGASRYTENKRSVCEKNMGPLIKTQMTRCIHCTRCVRFSTEVAGMDEVGAFGRGEHMEISTYLDQAVTSELSGNLVDICPVGALTSRPYAFKARSWELRSTESVDVMDAVGSNIRVDARGMEVMRILPRLHEDVNEEWISDKTRHACDGLKMQRLDRAYVRKEGALRPVAIEEAVQEVIQRLQGADAKKIGALVGEMADAESMTVLKTIWEHLESPHIDARPADYAVSFSDRSHYLFNTTIAGIEQADVILLVGANPRHEATILNARIKKRTRKPGCTVATIGDIPYQTYPVAMLGDDVETLQELVERTHAFSAILKAAKHPMVIVGESALTRKDGDQILALVHQLAANYGLVRDGWNGVNLLHKAASRVAALDLNLVPGSKGKNTAEQFEAVAAGEMEILFLMGVDTIPDTLEKRPENTTVIYLGHHGDKGAHFADIILPGAAYTEKNGTYVNLEGRVQRAYRAVSAPGEAQEDWKILAQIAAGLGCKEMFNSFADVRATMVKRAPHLAHTDVISTCAFTPYTHKGKGKLLKAKLKAFVDNYYMTDAISRHSPTMARCTQEIWKQQMEEGHAA